MDIVKAMQLILHATVQCEIRYLVIQDVINFYAISFIRQRKLEK